MSQIDWDEVGRFYAWAAELLCRHNGSMTSGCRTQAHNDRVGGNPMSKHTFLGGWGMAVDGWFEAEADRDRAVEEARAHPLYHGFASKHYSPRQAHFQGWKYMEKPHRRET